MDLEALFDYGLGSTICGHLDFRQIKALMRTSKTMYEHIRSDNLIWRRFLKEDPIVNR